MLVDEFPFEAVHNMAFLAPVVGQIILGILDDADPQPRILLRPPERRPRLSLMFRPRDQAPIDGMIRDAFDTHLSSLQVQSSSFSMTIWVIMYVDRPPSSFSFEPRL